ncbi:hypothetical protein Vretimale_8800 [Volvox reticuliferus]|uniref:Uncharacterized protein n=1 Tax=Volvox reticuliferus TaxID=1737510 RepID=A0A8J4GC61_9CHLO|nr:hypothetical protein Vretimale_8800 [Volvox reticuliferus]
MLVVMGCQGMGACTAVVRIDSTPYKDCGFNTLFQLLLLIWYLSDADSHELRSSFSSGSDIAGLTFCQSVHSALAKLGAAGKQSVSQLTTHLQLTHYHAGRLLELELRPQPGPHQSTFKQTVELPNSAQGEELLRYHNAQRNYHESIATFLLAKLQQELETSVHPSHTTSDSAGPTTEVGAPNNVDAILEEHMKPLTISSAGSALHLLSQCLLAASTGTLHNNLYNWALQHDAEPQPPAFALRNVLSADDQPNFNFGTRDQEGRPLVSLLVQYYNRPWMLPALVRPFRRCSEERRSSRPHVRSSSGDVGADRRQGGHERSGGADNGSGGASGSGGVGTGDGMLAGDGDEDGGVGVGRLGFRLEMLINVDSRGDAAAVAEFAAGPLGAGFLVPVYSSNVHEIRSYNRLTRLAQGKILIMLQDDDVFPDDTACEWLSSVVRAFKRWPRLGAVGSQRFVFDYHPNSTQFGLHFHDPGTGHWDPGSRQADASDEDRDAGNGDTGNDGSDRARQRLQPPPLQMQFVTLVDYAPVAVRRSAFLDVGGIDENMSQSGACGVHSDYDLVLRMWLAGWQVSYIEAPGLGKDPREPEGGTHRRGVSGYCWERQWELAIDYMRRRWGHYCRWDPDSYYWFGSRVSEVVSEHVRLLNLRLLRPLADSSRDDFICPFGYGCGKVPRDNITGVLEPVRPPIGNLSSWPKHRRGPWLARRRTAWRGQKGSKAAN